MSKKAARVLFSVLIIGGALSLLLVTTARESAHYYKMVDEVMVDPQPWYGKSLQLHGYVVDGSVRQRPGSLDLRFHVQNGGSQVLATYNGVVPDTFKDGAEVVLKGTLSPDGFRVEPNGVLAKCPSKYTPDATSGRGPGV